MSTKHTPGPWKADGYEIKQDCGDHGGRQIANFGPHHTPAHEYPASCRREDEANAAHVVRCVNTHAELLEALKWAEKVIGLATPDAPHNGKHECMEAIRAAIAKAEGGK